MSRSEVIAVTISTMVFTFLIGGLLFMVASAIYDNGYSNGKSAGWDKGWHDAEKFWRAND